MAKFCLVVVLAVQVFCWGTTIALEWNNLPDSYVYACVGGTVAFPWGFKAAADEQVLSVNWIHDGAMESSMVATMARDHFVATAGYSERVRHVDNGGIILEDLMAEDSGNYTIEVNVAQGAMFQSFRKSLYLQVGEGLMLEGELKADQDMGAVWDETSQQWFIRLTCGSFTFLGPPPLDVVWTTPDGENQPSAGYEAGQFFLSLATPVRGGDYKCTISPARLPNHCYQDQGGQNDKALSTSVSVDEIKARLSLLEANQKTLREDAQLKDNLKTLVQLDQELQNLQQTHARDTENVTEYCREARSSMQQQMDVMQGEMQAMQEQVEVLWNKTHHVPLTGPCKPENHKIINDEWRLSSNGQVQLKCDKDLEHGWYRFFVGSRSAVMPTTCVPKNHCNTHAPMWLDLEGKSLPEVGQETEARACAHWSSNCCNWKSPLTVRNCGAFFVYKLQPGDSCSLAYCVEYQE